MDVYTLVLGFLVALLVAVFYLEYRRNLASGAVTVSSSSISSGDSSSDDDIDRTDKVDDELHDIESDSPLSVETITAFRWRFLRVYGLAIAADWLQGSFTYSVYKDYHQLPERTIATLFATGFFVGGISAFWLGAFIDKHGRKLACLVYCVIYSISCLAMLTSNVPVLFIGRTLGGMSTTLLFTAFESWMTTECHSLGLVSTDSVLKSVYGTMFIMNGIIAAGSGIIAQFLVHTSGYTVSPFLASIGCLASAGMLITKTWTENYGESKVSSSASTKSLITQLKDPKILAIVTASSLMESSMYIMVYAWSQSLIGAHFKSPYYSLSTPNPPFGIIFSAFMCAMTLGSFLFNYLTRGENDTVRSFRIVQLALSGAAASLLVTVAVEGVAMRYMAFCAFELCVGMYFPSVGYVKARVVEDAQRGKVYGLIRVPLNALVVVALVTVKEGDASRDNRFVTCSTLLLLGSLLIAKVIK